MTVFINEERANSGWVSTIKIAHSDPHLLATVLTAMMVNEQGGEKNNEPLNFSELKGMKEEVFQSHRLNPWCEGHTAINIAP